MTGGQAPSGPFQPPKALFDHPPSDLRIHNRRISSQDLREAVSFPLEGHKNNEVEENEARRRSTVCYVCGPKPFTADVETHLNNFLHSDSEGHHGKKCVFHEVWW